MNSTVALSQNADFAAEINDAFSCVRMFKITTDGWQATQKIPLDTLLQAQSADEARMLLERQISRFLQQVGRKTDWLLTIPPIGANGFAIDLSKNDTLYKVMFGRLEQDFSTLAEALSWVERGLSEAYQLRVTSVGGRQQEWSLEPVADNSNQPTLASGNFVFFRSLRRVTHALFTNNFKVS